MTICRSLLVRIRHVSDKCCRENENTILCSVFFSKIVPNLDVMWKNMVQPDRPQMPIWRMRISCWIPYALKTHSQYAVPIAIPLQRRLHRTPQCYVICLMPVFLSSSSNI